MTDIELNKIMAVLSAAFPAFSRGMTEGDARAVLELWRRHLGHLPYEGVMAALGAVIDTQTDGFPPTIGRVKEQYLRLTDPPAPTAEEAWGMVLRALRNCGYHAREEFSRLPPEVQSAAGSPEVLHAWAMMETDELAAVAAPGFMRAYRARRSAERESRLLSPSTLDYVKTVAELRGNPALSTENPPLLT